MGEGKGEAKGKGQGSKREARARHVNTRTQDHRCKRPYLDSSASEFSPIPDAAGSVTLSATALQKLTVGDADVAEWAPVSVWYETTVLPIACLKKHARMTARAILPDIAVRESPVRGALGAPASACPLLRGLIYPLPRSSRMTLSLRRSNSPRLRVDVGSAGC